MRPTTEQLQEAMRTIAGDGKSNMDMGQALDLLFLASDDQLRELGFYHIVHPPEEKIAETHRRASPIDHILP